MRPVKYMREPAGLMDPSVLSSLELAAGPLSKAILHPALGPGPLVVLTWC